MKLMKFYQWHPLRIINKAVERMTAKEQIILLVLPCQIATSHACVLIVDVALSRENKQFLWK
jgi:hypothetical protein